MLSPFTAVGALRVDTLLPLEERRAPRRSQPQRLRFEPPGLVVRPRLTLDSPRPARRPWRLRVRLGRALLALGRRLAGPEAAS